ncbi:hypothetical protein BH23CHL9_BH23CHL9_14020 [soil metagenome]
MNWRVLGCGTPAAAVFVGVALWSVLRADAPAECPAQLPYEPAAYRQVGSATEEPILPGVADRLERTGTVSFGLARWDVWVEPGRGPVASGESLPERIVLDCGDGTFHAYERGTE